VNDSLKSTIEPKSDQLNYDDLLTGPVTVTVVAVKRSTSDEQPIDIYIDGHRPYRPCKSMRRVLIAAWGDQGADWTGKSMTLYGDPSVKYGGVSVGGIRISHLSDIDSPEISFMLTTSRSRRSGYTVKRLDKQSIPNDYPDDEFDKNAPAWVNAVKSGKITVPDVIKRASAKGRLTAAQVEYLQKETGNEPA
jgi:hypothetical protein